MPPRWLALLGAAFLRTVGRLGGRGIVETSGGGAAAGVMTIGGASGAVPTGPPLPAAEMVASGLGALPAAGATCGIGAVDLFHAGNAGLDRRLEMRRRLEHHLGHVRKEIDVVVVDARHAAGRKAARRAGRRLREQAVHGLRHEHGAGLLVRVGRRFFVVEPRKRDGRSLGRRCRPSSSRRASPRPRSARRRRQDPRSSRGLRCCASWARGSRSRGPRSAPC